MNDDNMRNRIKDTFETNVPDVLAQIKASPDFFVPQKRYAFNFKNIFKNRIAVSLMSIFIIALLIVGVSRGVADPIVASTVTLDINPSIEITLDEDDFVIGVSALNDDGNTVVQREVKYRGLTIEQVLDILIPRLESLGYIVTATDETNVILIEVDSDNESIRTRVENAFKVKLEMQMSRYGADHWVMNSRDIKLTATEQRALMQDQRGQMVTRAKLALIYRINILDDSYEIEDLLLLTVRQLYALFISLEDPDNLPEYDTMPGNHNNDPQPYNNSDENPSQKNQ